LSSVLSAIVDPLCSALDEKQEPRGPWMLAVVIRTIGV
jgi:hypothetical protein